MGRKKIKIIIFAVIAIIVISLGYYIHLNSGKPYFSTDFNIRMALDVESPLINTDEILSESNIIDITVLGKETISISKDRFDDDVYGTDQLDNRLELKEIDAILNSLKGIWEVDQYVGFVSPSLYYPDLFDPNDNLEEGRRTQLYQMYDKKVENAKNNIPEIYLSIKKWNGKDIENDYIYVNDNGALYESPISIIISIDRQSDDYPVFKDRTVIAEGFVAEYPVIYIKFIISKSKDADSIEYTPATLVITADNRFMVLIDGAFYSLKEVSETQQLIMEKLDIGIWWAKEIEGIFEKIGCGRIQAIDEIESDGEYKTYFIKDDEKQSFYLLMRYGSIEHIKNAAGELLYKP